MTRVCRLTGPLLLALALGMNASVQAAVRAEQITPENAGALLLQGPDAIGGLGDWALSNGVLCAIVSGARHEDVLTVDGGALVDFTRCDRQNDQFLSLRDLLNITVTRAPRVDRIQALLKPHTGTIEVSSSLDNVRVVTSYMLDDRLPDRLIVRSTYWREGAGPRVFAQASVMSLFGSLRPFTLALRPGAGSPPAANVTAGQAELAAIPAELLVAVGEAGIGGGASYGQQFIDALWDTEDGPYIRVPHFFLVRGLTSALVTLSANAPALNFGDLSGQMDELQMLDLPEGRRLVVEQLLWVGERADVASITNQVLAKQPLVKGRVPDPAARVTVTRAEGTPFTDALVDAEGAFSIRLPPGDYRLAVHAPGRPERVLDLKVPAEGLDLGDLRLEPAAQLILPAGQTMRLVFIGLEGTPDPDLSGGALASGPARNELNLGGLASDPGSISLAPGRYRVLAGRGPEYGVTETRLELAPGQSTTLRIEPPQREVATLGQLGVDMHVHAAPSFDSSVPVDERIRSFLAQGGEVLVASEHDQISDLGPDVQRLGATGRMVAVTAVEVTSEAESAVAPHTIGHGSVIPAPLQPMAYRHGAPMSENRRWRDVFAEVRQWPGPHIIQLNHARSGRSQTRTMPEESAQRAYFTHLGQAGLPFDPEQPLDSGPNRGLLEPDPATGLRDIDFTTFELMSDRSLRAYRQLREDWFSLLRQGFRLAGTAGSNSHNLAQVVAVPRTMVSLPEDLARFDVHAFVRAVNEGRSYGTTGPLFALSLAGKGPGEMLSASSGVLDIVVESAAWVDLATARIFVNGELLGTFPVEQDTTVSESLRFATDSFVTVELEGEPGEVYSAVLPGFVPFAFSNPIYVDADGDGKWTPPAQHR